MTISSLSGDCIEVLSLVCTATKRDKEREHGKTEGRDKERARSREGLTKEICLSHVE